MPCRPIAAMLDSAGRTAGRVGTLGYRFPGLVAPEAEVPWRDVLMSRGPKSERVSWSPRDSVRAELEQRVVRALDALGHLPIQDVDAVMARRVRNGAKAPVLS